LGSLSMLLSALALLACGCSLDDLKADGGETADDDGPVPGATTGCASACERIYGCGYALAADGVDLTQTECTEGCQADSGYSALASCVNGAPDCGSAAACFEGGPPSGNCASCGDFLNGYADYEQLCSYSQSLVDNFATCLCAGACSEVCGNNVCEGQDPSASCQSCTGCGAEIDACLAD